ncbi:hypothetical protein GQ55_2G061300 [Panicum hallii var. hallii]|uniref:TIR domain-containing protein n=1 Tax=Panicum hallii var. hallii TaxID=1504633 RepID=A0A2T7EM03_9POAL|nr:hypothetical protein GQ55_2G061300 [Panicum hallii var. hallii]
MASWLLRRSVTAGRSSSSMSMAAVRLNTPPPPGRAYDVFINHRGADTRHTLARQLYDRLLQLSGGRVRPFLDNVSLRPGDRLVARIDEGISQCKVAVAIFSEGYLDSAFCLHELASLVEARKVIVPIFYGVKPSGLVLPPAVVESSALAPRDVERFRAALREASYTVGLTYDPATGDLAELVSAAANAVMKRIEETETSVQ